MKIYIKNDGELYHHGVKGMKWGVRHDYVPIGRHRVSKKTLKKTTGLGLAGKAAATLAGATALGVGAHVIRKKTGISATDALASAKSMKDLVKPVSREAKQVVKNKEFKKLVSQKVKEGSISKEDLKKKISRIEKAKSTKENRQIKKIYTNAYNKSLAKDTIKKAFRNRTSEILEAANVEAGKNEANSFFNGLKKGVLTGIGTTGGVGIVGGVTYGLNSAVSGEFDRRKLAEYVAPNPTKAKFDRKEDPNERRKRRE